jgi:rod shape-determining protein MreC
VSLKKITVFILAVWCALWLVIKIAPSSSSIRNGLSRVFYFPFRAIAGISESGSILLKTQANLIKENKTLKKDLLALQYALGNLGELKQENRRLKELLGIKRKEASFVVAATPIARDSVNFFRSIVIDKGTREGIDTQTFIATADGLAGRVVETGPDASRVMLVTDPESKITAIVSTTRDQGIVYGTGKSFLVMKYLPPSTDIQPKALVITSGLGGFYPKGLVIGSIVRVHKDPTGLYSYAIIAPSAELNKLEEVLCLK